MCAACHLAQVSTKATSATDSIVPPNLTSTRGKRVEMFWVVKHGIKMSAMPAWGKTHDDHSIWGIVAFLQAAELSSEQYQRYRTGG
jgi:mono/diheme cytochrome c family protein